MKYESLCRLSQQKIEKNLLDSDLEVVRRTVASLSQVDADASWIEEKLTQLLSHPDEWVAGAAIMGFSDMAREQKLHDEMAVQTKFRILARERPTLEGRIGAALEDISLFSRQKE